MKDLEQLLAQQYRVTISPIPPDEGGGWFAEIPDLPGCMSDGETPEEALRNLEDARQAWIKTAVEHGDPVPTPTGVQRQFSGKFLVRGPRSLHRDLTRLAEAQGVSLNQYVVYLLARGVQDELRTHLGDGQRIKTDEVRFYKQIVATWMTTESSASDEQSTPYPMMSLYNERLGLSDLGSVREVKR